ncbi:MAG: DNA polymerase III subunit delta' [Halioglobus sp.]
MDITALPQVNAPLPWHHSDWQQMHDQLSQGKLPHALLLAAEPDVGVAHLALSLARLLLCSEPQAGLNCGECQACRLSATGAHGDFLWVQPEEKSKTIKIDQVRQSVEFLNKTAGFGARKVVVFSPADAMNTSAFNALLKSLEEPTADTYLILACHALHNVPATIRSRCQLRRLGVPAAKESLDWLEPQIGSRETGEALLDIADGRPLLAQKLYLDDSAQSLAARRAGLQAVCTGRVAASEAAQLWGAVDTMEMLDELTAHMQRVIRSFSPSELQSASGREAFLLLDELGSLQRAVSAGSNPGRGILVDALLSKFHRVLGGA